MRRFLLLLGFLLLPQTVSAAALSLWVQHVIDRAEIGVEVAGNLFMTESDPAAVVQIENNLSKIRDARSTAFDFTNESEFLRERTLCFENDRILMEEELQKIYDALRSAAESNRIQAASLLLNVYAFTYEANQSFLRGALDPSFADDRLRQTYLFDNPGEDHAGEPLCPYTTDYGPHAIGYVPASVGDGAFAGDASFDVKSYGCDSVTLQHVHDTLPDSTAGDTPYALSLDALRTEADDRIRFLSESESLATDLFTLVSEAVANINSTIAIITGQSEPEPFDGSTIEPPPHDSREGCLRPPSPEVGGRGDPADLHALLAAFPDYFDKKNLRLDDTTGLPTFEPLPDRTLPVGVLFRSTQDYFSAMPNAFGLSRGFADRKSDIGFDRPFSSALMHFDTGTAIGFLWKGITQGALRFIAANTERETSFVEAVSRDSQERNQKAVEPLASAVRALTDVTQHFLPEKYIPSVAYFLRRSCVDGHCNKTLDSVLKRTFNPFCHPYVSGAYKDPRTAQKCFCIEKSDDDQNGLDLDGCDRDSCNKGGSADCTFFKKYCSDNFCAEDYDALREKEGEPILCGEQSSSSSSEEGGG